MRGRQGGRRRSTPLACALALALATDVARAEEIVPDRTAVRFVTAETGGAAKPRFLTERELAFFARTEAVMDGLALEADEYPERYVRVATERLVARAMLSSLMIQQGTEPPELAKLALEVRADLADRVGGAAALEQLMKREGIDDAELAAFLRDLVRATWYADKGVTPILAVTEDSLREAHRAAVHPYKTLKFEDARARLKRWLVAERERVAELEFLQGARARVKITAVR